MINIANVSLLGAEGASQVGFVEGISLTFRMMETCLKACLDFVHAEGPPDQRGEDVTGLVYVEIVCAWLSTMEENGEPVLRDKVG